MPDLERERRLRSKQNLDTRLEFILSGEGYGERFQLGALGLQAGDFTKVGPARRF